MNWASWLLWGFAATILMTSLMAGSQGLGMTRMNIPSCGQPDRSRAWFVYPRPRRGDRCVETMLANN